MIKQICLMFGLMLCVSACASLPTTGPSVSNVSNYPGARMVAVDATMARVMRERFQAEQDAVLNQALHSVSQPMMSQDYILQAGDQLTVSLTSWSSVVNASTGNYSSTMEWDVAIAANGEASLPYLKQPLQLAGMSLPAAQTQIAALYERRRIFLSPSVQISVSGDNAGHGVMVTGTVGAPKIIPWSAGGLTMAQALTKSLGNGQVISFQQNDLNGGTSATTVTLVRKGQSDIILPIDVALAKDIPLAVGDKLIVSNKPAVQVTVTGGGIANGLYDFAQHPSLAQTIAKAKGLNPQTANAKAVYVFRNGQAPTLYSFAFKTTDAQFAAQQFPLMDGDIVYVAEAGIVPFQQVMASIWPIAQFATVVN